MKDFYYILGTDNKATLSQLNAAYRKLAQKLQPRGDNEDDFINSHFDDITEAYQTLSNPIARRKYDAALKKAHQNRFYFFKIRYINIAVTLALIVFTALFGYYVIQSINSTKIKKAVTTPALVAQPVKHSKKKRATKLAAIVTHKHPDTMHRAVVASVPLRIIQAPVIPIPAIQNTVEEIKPTNTTAQIQANATGLVYLHQQATYQSAVLASIPNHAQVQILEKGVGFYKITFQDKTGYVPKWTVVIE